MKECKRMQGRAGERMRMRMRLLHNINEGTEKEHKHFIILSLYRSKVKGQGW